MDSDSLDSAPVKTLHLPFTIYPSLSSIAESEELAKYVRAMRYLLEKLIPEKEFFEDTNDLLTWINEQLPVIKWSETLSPPDCLNVYLLCRSSREVSIESFFRNVLTRNLSGEKNISFLSLRHLDMERRNKFIPM